MSWCSSSNPRLPEVDGETAAAGVADVKMMNVPVAAGVPSRIVCRPSNHSQRNPNPNRRNRDHRCLCGGDACFQDTAAADQITGEEAQSDEDTKSAEA